MANLTESPIYEPGIFQLEKTTPPLGGAPALNGSNPSAGHANVQALQLANRTAYLKQQLDLVAEDVPSNKSFSNYTTLRAYTGSAIFAKVLKPSISGNFYRDENDNTSPDNGVTTFIDAIGRRWKRIFQGRVNVRWADITSSSTVDNLAGFTAASVAASAVANGLSGDVDVPAGNWFLSAPVTTSANWYIDGAATIYGLPVVGSPTIPIHDTSYLTGRVFDYRAGTAAQVRIGSPEPYLSKIRTISECISTLAVSSPSGRNAILATTRTSDRPDTGALSYALSFSAINDDATNVKGSWGGYGEQYRYPGAGTSLSMEMDFLNLGDTQNLDPFNVFTPGITCHLWLSCGGGSTPEAPNANDISAHITTIKNAKGALRGWVVRDGSIVGAEKEVIAMPLAHRLAWYSAASTVRSYLDDKEHRRTVSSNTLTDSPLDTTRKIGAGNAAPLADSVSYLHDMQTFNGSSYTQSAFSKLLQKTGFVGGFARFCYSIMARTSTGANTEVGINMFGDNEFTPSNDGVVNSGRADAAWNQTYSKSFRPGNGTVRWTSGAGSPEGVLTAVVGSMYTRTDGGAGTTLYIKESGTGSTGWVAK